MNVQLLPVADILVGERLRMVDAEKVTQIALSLRQTGQITPIEVRPGPGEKQYVLIAGAHRLAAAREAGMLMISASIFEGNADQVRLREIDENLYRHELNPFDQAAFLAERKDVYERLHPEAKQGGNRKGDQTANLAVWSKSFAADTAERLGLGERTVFRAISRHLAIEPKARGIIAGTHIAKKGSELDALGKVPRDRQAEIARFAVEKLCSIVEARRSVLNELPPARPDTGFSALQTAFRKARATDKARFLEWLDQDGYLDPLYEARDEERAQESAAGAISLDAARRGRAA